MVKEEEIMAEVAGGGRPGYLDILGLGEEAAMADYFCLSPSSPAVVSTTTSATPGAAAAFSPTSTCASYLLAPPPCHPHHHVLSFGSQAEQQYLGGGGDIFGFQYYGGDRAVPVAIPQRSSPTTECSSSISSMSSSPTAISSSKPQQALKKKGSRGADQRKTASASTTNKRPRVRKERLGERILALQQLVSPFGKSDTASVLHEALGYIRFLHDQVQVLSSPYMQRLPPPSARDDASKHVQVVVEQPPRRGSGDLRSRGLCLVPISCTDHVAGGGGSGGADVWSTVTAGLSAAATPENREAAAAAVLGDRPWQLA